jgi:hypothetical protein
MPKNVQFTNGPRSRGKPRVLDHAVKFMPWSRYSSLIADGDWQKLSLYTAKVWDKQLYYHFG